MFSLSNNDKFIYNKEKRAIVRTRNKKCIYFGGGEIFIKDMADSNNICKLDFNYSYFN